MIPSRAWGSWRSAWCDLLYVRRVTSRWRRKGCRRWKWRQWSIQRRRQRFGCCSSWWRRKWWRERTRRWRMWSWPRMRCGEYGDGDCLLHHIMLAKLFKLQFLVFGWNAFNVHRPSTQYSAQMKMAEMIYPAINSRRNTSCARWWWWVSKMDNRINPHMPMMAKRMLKIERIFSFLVVLGTSRPLWRSRRSAANDRSRNTVVTADPAMKRGFSLAAPMSLMNAMLSPLSI